MGGVLAMLVPQQSENLLGMPRKSIKNQNLKSPIGDQ